jgi:hypothetical protein
VSKRRRRKKEREREKGCNNGKGKKQVRKKKARDNGIQNEGETKQKTRRGVKTLLSLLTISLAEPNSPVPRTAGPDGLFFFC